MVMGDMGTSDKLNTYLVSHLPLNDMQRFTLDRCHHLCCGCVGSPNAVVLMDGEVKEAQRIC